MAERFIRFEFRFKTVNDFQVPSRQSPQKAGQANTGESPKEAATGFLISFMSVLSLHFLNSVS